MIKTKLEKKMSIISIREITPHVGKTDQLIGRVKRAADIMSRHGSQVAVSTVVVGDGAGDIHMYGLYPDCTVAAKSFQSFSKDPEMVSLSQERETNPAGEMRGPLLARLIYGSTPGTPKPVSVQRDYHMSRSNIRSVLEMAPGLEKLMKSIEVEVAVGVPLITSDHEMIRVMYRFSSMDHWGESVDFMLNSEEFTKILAKASSLGTLKKSRLISRI